MVKITTKEKDNIQARNVAIVFGKDSVIRVSRKNRKNILHTYTYTFTQLSQLIKKYRTSTARTLEIKTISTYQMLIKNKKTCAALCAMGYIAD